MSLVAIDPVDASSLHRRPFTIRHGLADHPLFRLERLVELARRMPRDRIEYNSGRVEPGVRPEDVPGIDMPAEEVIRRIRDCHAWMVIKSVEEDPEYGALLTRFLGDMARAAGLSPAIVGDPQGFLFVSSANSTTPFHFDAEENILVQIRGDKFVHIFDNEDRTLVGEEALEIAPSKHRNQPYEAGFETRATVFALKPGEGVHIPYTHPHWVRTGTDYSISMAMTWKTPEVERLNKLRLMNATLRRFGLPQRAPGASAVLDAAKVAAHDAARAMIDPLRRSERMRRILRGAIYGRGANYYLKDDQRRDGVTSS